MASNRELQVLKLLANGLGTIEISINLKIKPSTVRQHIRMLMIKNGVNTRTALVAKALRAKEIR